MNYEETILHKNIKQDASRFLPVHGNGCTKEEIFENQEDVDLEVYKRISLTAYILHAYF